MSHQHSKTQLEREITRRRTFAIISHPDAGKTTITEKLLLYGGAIREAGTVKGKGSKKMATSDWMAIEQERGISVTSSVLQFEYAGLLFNLLDTPGHQDFSEDTYRTLMAADSAVMMLNNAKGVEPQTRKLFEVCKLRSIPIFTFVNKLDREGMEGLDLLDNIEKELGLLCTPITWPIGMGQRFKGVVHLLSNEVHLFKNVGHGSKVAEEERLKLDDPRLATLLGDEVKLELLEEIELVRGAGVPWEEEAFQKGEITPVFFGSALNNFGLSNFLEYFKSHSPAPVARESDQGRVDPFTEPFSAFVFKIQANMDKSHRDRIAFMRICSGKFIAGEKAFHSRLGREVRLAQPQQFLARERAILTEAYAGDIIGIHDPGHFRIGDTLSSSGKVTYSGIPQFSPEIFSRVELKSPLKRKHLQKGLKELCEEGTIQLFYDPRVGDQDPILGAVGQLQLDVLVHRLNAEYGAEAKLSPQSWARCRWITGSEESIRKLQNGGKVLMVKDQSERWVCLAKSDWDLNWVCEHNKDIEFKNSMDR